jgi:hypothetical protein
MSEVQVDLVDEVDLEEYARRGVKVPPARRYRIRIQKTFYTVTTPVLTGRELLDLAGKTPETHNLYQIIRGQQPSPVAPDAKVDLRTPGIERFTLVPRDPTEGLVVATEVDARRDFALGETDRDYLDTLGLAWETVKEGSQLWLLLPNWVLPDGYNVRTATLALRIPEAYPDTQIDMVYFSPALSRADGVAIRQLTPITILGQPYQQWSRHRTPANPWKPGHDDVSTHLALVDDWLRREFQGK